MTRTNARTLMCVLIRCGALYFFIVGAIGIVGAMMLAGDGNFGELATRSLVGNGLILLLSLSAWTFSDIVAGFANGKPGNMIFESNVSAQDWHRLAFAAIGLWQSVEASVILVNRMVGLLLNHLEASSDGMGPRIPDSFWSSLVAEVVRLTIGLGLVFGTRGIAGMIQNYRQIGYTRPDASEPSNSDENGSTKPDPTLPE